MSIDYMKDQLDQEDGYEKVATNTVKVKPQQPGEPYFMDNNIAIIKDPPGAQRAYEILRNPPEYDEAASPSSSSHPQRWPYKIIRSLPGYTIGDVLRAEEKILCYSKDATLFAMNKLRANDCAFLRRSDGSFTYSLYEGRVKGDDSSLSFRIDEGHIKRIPISKFCTLVKVPVLLGRVALDPVASTGRRRSRRSSISHMPISQSQRSEIIRGDRQDSRAAYSSMRRLSLSESLVPSRKS